MKWQMVPLIKLNMKIKSENKTSHDRENFSSLFLRLNPDHIELIENKKEIIAREDEGNSTMFNLLPLGAKKPS